MSFPFENDGASSSVQHRHHCHKEEDDRQTDKSPESRGWTRWMREIRIAAGDPSIADVQGCGICFWRKVEQSQDATVIGDPDVGPKRPQPGREIATWSSNDSDSWSDWSNFPRSASSRRYPSCRPRPGSISLPSSSSTRPYSPDMCAAVPDPPTDSQSRQADEFGIIMRDPAGEHVEDRADFDQRPKG